MRKYFFWLLLGGVLTWIAGNGAFAYGNIYTDAVAFYDSYGSGKLVFSDGAFYYSSRGKEGNPKGIRYGVLGQQFMMKMDNGKSYTIEIALESDSEQGSCKRVSYVKKDGYYYSLYCVSYDKIFQRMQSRYPDVDFDRLMYNRKICFQIDFLLSLVIDGKDQGNVKELENGRTRMNGIVYQNLEQIRNAADWSQETREALENYYEIQMDIYQPSTWYISFDKNHKAAVGSMDKQVFTYGNEEKLTKCSFQKVITVTLDPGDGTWRGESLHPFHTLLKSQFLGWSLTTSGKMKYKDQEQVKNLSWEQGAVIRLYALWSEKQMIFPDCQRDDCEFLGWSTEKYDILPAESSEKDVEKEKLYIPGDSYIPARDSIFYAVWKWKRYQVQFRQPEEDLKASKVDIHYYNEADVQEIRRLIESCGFAGSQLNKMLIGREKG